MGNKSWQELATKAKDIARRIVNGDEENKNGERLIHIVYRLDTFATNALNKKFAQSGSIGSVHTYAGGTQVISTRHADGSEGSFNTDGECTPTDNPMDIEVDAYINGGNGGGGGQSSPAAPMVLPESKTNRNMKKNTIKINESQLRKIITESVKRVLNEYAEGNEISPVPGDKYNPTPKSLIETIINEMQHIKTLCENTFQSIVHSDIGNARKGLSKMNQSLDVALDRVNELQGFIDYNDNENY